MITIQDETITVREADGRETRLGIGTPAAFAGSEAITGDIEGPLSSLAHGGNRLPR